MPEESSLSGLLVGYKKLYNEISEKSIKRLKHEGEDKSDKLKDKNSPYYENE